MTPCSFGIHDWSQWQVRQVQFYVYRTRDTITGVDQVRTCSRCGLTQSRTP